MNGILLLLGSNLGDRIANLNTAIKYLEKSGMSIKKFSSVYESEPWGIADQPWFVNQVIEVETDLGPEELLQECLSVESAMGRVRKLKWGERLIDIDILFYNNVILESSTLKIPHPGIPSRRFTLEPLAECWPNAVHPTVGLSFESMLEYCTDTLRVIRL